MFALNTAMRLAHGFGFLSSEDVQTYLTSAAVLDRLAAAGLVDDSVYADTTIVRPWPGPPRLLACVVKELPPSREVSGHRLVQGERLKRELIRYQLLVRLTQRTVGVAPPSPTKPGKRKRKPLVRAMRRAEQLHQEASAPEPPGEGVEA